MEDVEKKIVEEPKPLLEEGTEFLKDAQWCILRGKDNTALVAKGGNNDEPHNHNDVGSFLYLADGEALLEDLGSSISQMNAMKFSVHAEKVITCRSSVV